MQSVALRLLIALALVLAGASQGVMAGAGMDPPMADMGNMAGCDQCDMGIPAGGGCDAICGALAWGEPAPAISVSVRVDGDTWRLFDEWRPGTKPAPPRAPPRS